ncbi:MAG: helix-turn-helix transcriptional regulator [Planctomycetota bacterium]|nr:helix-turn-helix transcriptional regulator [Planctomycetota bacterium]
MPRPLPNTPDQWLKEILLALEDAKEAKAFSSFRSTSFSLTFSRGRGMKNHSHWRMNASVRRWSRFFIGTPCSRIASQTSWGLSASLDLRRRLMGKTEQMLKSEIMRLAKKAVRTTCLPLARDLRRLNRSVSALRKTVAPLARLGAELQAERTAERATLAAAPEEVKAARLSALLIKKLRRRLGITQGKLAALVGVSHRAVGSWEYGKTKPEECPHFSFGGISDELAPRARDRHSRRHGHGHRPAR